MIQDGTSLFGMVYIVFWMLDLGLGGEHFVFWMVCVVLWTVNFIFWRTIYFWGWVCGDLEDIFCILNGDYANWDYHLVFQLIYFVFIRVYLVF